MAHEDGGDGLKEQKKGGNVPYIVAMDGIMVVACML